MNAPPLPILAISLDAYRILFRNFGTFLRLSWLPFLTIIAASTGIEFFYRDVAGWADDGNALLRMSAIFFEGCLWILTIPVATAWTRMLLLNGDPWVHLSLGRAEAIYLWRYVCLSLVALGPGALVVAMSVVIPGFPSYGLDSIDPEASTELFGIILAAIFILVVAFSLIMVSRLLLALPAAAIGNASRLRDSFALTKGRMWALVAILILTMLPEWLGSLVPIIWESDTELGPNDGIFSAAWIAIQYYVASWLFFPVSVGALALAYRHLGGMSDEPTDSAVVLA
jgi:hypothetical protein